MPFLLKNALTLSEGKPYTFSRKDVLIGNGGQIEEVEKSEAILKIPQNACEKIDCSNKILLPGFVNAHTHAPMSLLRAIADDLQLNDWIHKEMRPRQKQLTSEHIKTGTKLAIAEMIRSGTTCFNDHYFYMDSVMEATVEAGMRACLGYSMIDLGEYETTGRAELKIAKEFAQKINAENKKNKKGVESKEQLVFASIDPHAPNTCSPKLLMEAAKLAKEMNCLMHVHASETRAELAFTLKNSKLRPIQLLDKCKCLGSKTILAHGSYVSKSEVDLIAKRGASVAHCPVSNLKLANGGAAPIPEYLKAGVNLCLGTDSAASNNSLNIFESMKVGLLEQKNFRFDPTILKADDYLAMATIGGARALGLRAGKIKKGFLADLVLLDLRAPNLVPYRNNAGWIVYAAGPQNVCDVMVNGKWLMRERKLLTLDEEKVLEDAQKIADKIR